jgi:hypothetical protein
MPNYFSKKVKTTPNNKLSSDRNLFLNLEQAEPNLGYPGEKSGGIPLSQNYYKLVTTDSGTLNDRYWLTEPPANFSANGISIYDENILVGTAGSVSKINFLGEFIRVTASGSISTVTFGPPEGNNGRVVFTDNNGNLSFSDKLLFNPLSGILTVGSQFDVGIGGTIFTIKNDNVGINVSNPSERLHVNGNVRITGLLQTQNINVNSGIATFTTIKTSYLRDSNNSIGSANQILSSTDNGLLWINKGIGGSWIDNSGIRTDNVTYTNNTGSLLYVSATPGIDRIAENLISTGPAGGSEIVAGSYSIAEVDGIEVARTRDNGTFAAEFIFLNVKFFVPNGSSYVVKVYNTTGTQWLSSITTYAWSEFKFS